MFVYLWLAMYALAYAAYHTLSHCMLRVIKLQSNVAKLVVCATTADRIYPPGQNTSI